MNNKIAIIFIILFLMCGLLPLQSQQSFAFTEDIVVAEDEVQNNVVSFGGNVLIEGEVKEGVVSFGGEVTISGEVGDVVLGFGSNITLKSTAIVQGDVFILGGELTKEPGCTIEGDTVYFGTSDEVSQFLKEGFAGVFGFSLFPILIILKLITLVIWFILAIILVAIFPKQISYASNQIRTSFWPIFGTGILSIIIFTGLILFSVFLCFILIGIPILLALVAIGIIIKIFGRVVVFYFLGDWIFKAFGGKQTSGLLAVILGLLLFGLLGFLPIIGSLFAFFLSIIGWGVVVRTKFGSVENWFKRK